MSIIEEAIRHGQRRRMALSIAEAAVEAGVARDKVYEAIREGRTGPIASRSTISKQH